ncbi:MAG TPA: M1 family metallopeptidase [Gemmatimonadales bacterium]
MRNISSSLTAALLTVIVAPGLAAQHASIRPIPYPVDMPNGFVRALANGTRSSTGAPGPKYWQQWTDYTIRARLDTDQKRITGSVALRYHNRSPDALPQIMLQVIQNVHAEGAVRNRPAEVTGGVEITQLAANGETLGPLTFSDQRRGRPGYRVAGTTVIVQLSTPLASGESTELEVGFTYTVPQRGAGGRMGWNGDNLFYLAYWYPQLAVYDDVGGWQTDAFLGSAEFYMGYGSYDVTLEVPEGWVVMGTGTLTNPDEAFPDEIAIRLRRAAASDDVVHVLTADDLGPGKATRRSDSGLLAWRFRADSVRDAAYSVTRESLWDAARTPVGDRNGDGITDYARVDAIYRASAPLWTRAWRYAQHSIDFLSRWTGYPYPWPHMTAVEGGGIMGGGMEYPMMTLIGAYTQGTDTSLYGVTAHELAHMWVPMLVGNDERRMAWMDEGTTSFNGDAAEMEFFPGMRSDLGEAQGYIQVTHTDMEGPIMTWSDFHTNGFAYGTASYSKPATMLWTLRGLLGEEAFTRAYEAYIARWAFKHPKPWDFFHTFNDVSGQNLDWFWRTWYYETWALDQAVADVVVEENRTRIVIEDRGRAPMPARLTITTADGQVLHSEVPVSRWLEGATTADVVIRTTSRVVKVEIDASQAFPDVDRSNNVWQRT